MPGECRRFCREFSENTVRPLTPRISFLNEIRNSGVGARERLFVRQEDDAEVLRAGLLAEAGAVNYHDVFLADEFFDEDFVALGDIDFGVGVKSPAGSDAAHARRRLAPFLREIAAGAQLALHFDQVILRAFERGLDGVLFRMVGAQARAQQAMNAFCIRLYGRSVAGNESASPRPPLAIASPPVSSLPWSSVRVGVNMKRLKIAVSVVRFRPWAPTKSIS